MPVSRPLIHITLSIPIGLSLFLSGCGGGGGTSSSGGGSTTATTSTPTITAAAAQNGAQIVTLADSASSATIYFTMDGTAPSTSSPVYEAPFLVSSSLTVKAMAKASGENSSTVASQDFTVNAASGTLVWSDEFSNTTAANAQPSATTWTYDTGAGGWGNSELEDYCAWGSTSSPCDTANPNAYVGTDGYLHIVARQPSSGVYTSARMKSQGLFSFQYGRVEIRAQVPEGQGFWPAFWLLGNSISTASWPACGEMDVLERVNAATSPDWNTGSIHGTGFTGSNLGTTYFFPSGTTAADWHTYGMIWTKDSVSYYIDDPSNPYATFTSASISGFSGSKWPFDNGQNAFLIMNIAVGGSWPGSPDSSTVFPAEMLVDYVRIYTN